MIVSTNALATEGARPIVVVTGGASGIGLAIVRQLMSEGWDTVVADANAAAIETLRAERFPAGVCMARQIDVSDSDAVAAIFGALDAGRVRGLVNAAGIGQSVPFLETPVDMFRRTVDVNLVGTFIVAQAAAARMAQGEGGAIVNISSGSALRGNAGRAAYGASKGGVEVLSKVMAVELAASNIRVNSVAPGPIETPLVATMHSAADRARALRSVPQGRYGRAEDVAMAVSFLLDERRSGYMTGHTLCVDGGFAAAGSFTPADA